MASQYYLILLAIMFADLSNCDDSCPEVMACLEPLQKYDAFSKFIIGPDLNAEICDTNYELFGCMREHLPACDNNAMAVEAEVIMNEFGYLCHSRTVIQELQNSYCMEERYRDRRMEDIRGCFSHFQDIVNHLVEDQNYCRAARELQYCPREIWGSCGSFFEGFYTFLYEVYQHLPQPNGMECYAEYLAADMIRNKMLA